MDAVLMCGGRGTRLGVDREKPLVEVGGVPTAERVRRALAAAGGVDRVIAVVSPDAPATRAWAEGVEGGTDRAEGAGFAIVEGSGDGYVADLRRGLEEAGAPAVTTVADLPLLGPDLVDGAVRRATREADGAGRSDGTDGANGPGGVDGTGEADDDGGTGDRDADPSVGSLAVCVPTALKRALGASVDAAFVPGTDPAGDGAAPDDSAPAGGGRRLSPTGLNVVGDGPDRRWVSWDARLAANVNRPGDLDLARRLAGDGARDGRGDGDGGGSGR